MVLLKTNSLKFIVLNPDLKPPIENVLYPPGTVGLDPVRVKKPPSESNNSISNVKASPCLYT